MRQTQIDISEFPCIPEEMLLAAKMGVLVPFVGAGVSMLAGCPSWSGFADGALKSFVHTKHLSRAQYDQLMGLPARVKLTLARDMESQHRVDINYKKILEPKSPNKIELAQRAYEGLRNLSRFVITTNYDEFLDKPLVYKAAKFSNEGFGSQVQINPNVIYKVDDISPQLFNRSDAIIHIHGSVKDRDSMVVTTTDYLNRYSIPHRGQESKYLKFLEILFRQRKILFVGYGLEELEILEYIFIKSRFKNNVDESQATSHFLLQGFFSHEAEIASNLVRYFKKFGIHLIPFLRDKNGYAQLVPIIENFVEKMPARDVSIQNDKALMEGLL